VIRTTAAHTVIMVDRTGMTTDMGTGIGITGIRTGTTIGITTNAQ
jgi:hypothetical protein